MARETSRWSVTSDEIVERHASIRFTNPGQPVRTLWYALYDTQRLATAVILGSLDPGQLGQALLEEAGYEGRCLHAVWAA